MVLDLTQPARLPDFADVVVIGGGITGVCLLHWLRELGVNAVLVERERLASGASGRNAGLVLHGIAANYSDAVRRHGRGVAREVWQLTQESHSRLTSLLPGGGVRYQRRGSWALASDQDEAEQLEESAALLGTDGFAVTWTRELPARLDRFAGGLLNRSDGELDPAAAVQAIAHSFRDVVHERAEVEGCEFSNSECATHTNRGVVRSRAIVLATNAWTQRLAPQLSIEPTRGQMLATAPVADVVVERPCHSHGGSRYWRQLSDGRIVVGGYGDEAPEEEMSDRLATTTRIQSLLERHLRDVIGVQAEVTHRWAGIMGFTADELPLVGALPGSANGFVCAGYSGRGMGMAARCAELVARSMVLAEPIPAWLRPDRELAPAD